MHIFFTKHSSVLVLLYLGVMNIFIHIFSELQKSQGIIWTVVH